MVALFGTLGYLYRQNMHLVIAVVQSLFLEAHTIVVDAA